MKRIRPLEPDDLPHVAALYERVARSGSPAAAPGLLRYFERTLLESPWTDPEIPSLVYDDPREGIVAFIGSHVRRLSYDDRPLRMGCSGQLVAHPSAGPPAVGALLMRAYLSGPQDLSITDGATETVRAMWERLGGTTLALASIGWTRPFRPLRLAAELARRRGGRAGGRAASVVAALDPYAARLADRWLAPPAPETRLEPLGPEGLVEQVRALRGSLRLVPDYDPDFARWLWGELSVLPGHGRLHARSVLASNGSPAGWYVAFMRPGVSQVLQLGSLDRDSGTVVDALVHDAAMAGSAALAGRLEPGIASALLSRRCLLRRSEWALAHSSDAALLGTITAGDALLTRLDGEWWMGHHLAGPFRDPTTATSEPQPA